MAQRLVDVKAAGPGGLAAWRRTGSPALCEGGKKCAAGLLRPGQTRYMSASGKNVGYLGGGLRETDLNMVKIATLPDDPVALRSALLGSWPTFLAGQRRAGVKQVTTRDEWLWTMGTSLLQDAPAPPRVRAALYRMLADVPGARVLDDDRTVTVARRGEGAIGDHHVVIDRTTGELWAFRRVSLGPDPRYKDMVALPKGSVTSEITVLSAGWTDEEPVLPDRCGQSACIR